MNEKNNNEIKHLKIKNWADFQHYKDRMPPWIKLHQELLSSKSWVLANDSQKALLVTIMLLSARTENYVPFDANYVKKVANLDVEPDLNWLVECGFCELSTKEDSWHSPWPSRNVSVAMKNIVLSRDKCTCVICGSKTKLEIDHVVPVSAGGKSEVSNLQTLCRSCNRRKHASVANATIKDCQRSTKAEAESEAEKRREEDIQTTVEGWRKSFEAYSIEEKAALSALQQDGPWIAEKERLNPGLDVRLSLEKAHLEFWGIEAGWKHKKKSKAQEIDWRATYTKALSLPSNRVWRQKSQQGGYTQAPAKKEAPTRQQQRDDAIRDTVDRLEPLQGTAEMARAMSAFRDKYKDFGRNSENQSVLEEALEILKFRKQGLVSQTKA
jgi:hypothetical protein